MTLTIEYNGVKVVKPKGRVGVIHFGLLNKYLAVIKEYQDSGRDLDTIGADDRIIEIFEKWVEKVLPKIIVSDHDPDEIPFDTLWVLFNKTMSEIDIPDEESFR